MKRRHLTLIELMIVIVLIGLIGSVVAYNLGGSLSQGKIFKTEQGGARLYETLTYELANGADLGRENWQSVIAGSPLVKNAKELCKDGWGKEYEVSFDPDSQEICITSERYNKYYQDKYGRCPDPLR